MSLNIAHFKNPGYFTCFVSGCLGEGLVSVFLWGAGGSECLLCVGFLWEFQYLRTQLT